MADIVSREQQQRQRELLTSGVDTNTPVGDEKKTSVTISGAEGGKSEFINGIFEIRSSSTMPSQNDGHYVYNFKGADSTSNSKIVFLKNKWYIITGAVLDDEMLSTGNLNTLHAVVECPSDKSGCELKDCVSQQWKEYVGGADGKATLKDSEINMVVNTSEFSDIPIKGSMAAADPPAQTPDVPDLNTMKTICSSAVEAHDAITKQFRGIVYTDTNSISSFVKELDKTIAGLKDAQASLDAYKKANATPPSGTQVGGSSSSSSSKKNRKSHKSYHPDIGKTRKHHYNADHKRVSFVHQA